MGERTVRKQREATGNVPASAVAPCDVERRLDLLLQAVDRVVGVLALESDDGLDVQVLWYRSLPSRKTAKSCT